MDVLPMPFEPESKSPPTRGFTAANKAASLASSCATIAANGYGTYATRRCVEDATARYATVSAGWASGASSVRLPKTIAGAPASSMEGSSAGIAHASVQRERGSTSTWSCG